MSLIVIAQPAPLTTDPEGVVRISATRVTLDTVVAAFQEGATAEEISQQYPSLQLAMQPGRGVEGTGALPAVAVRDREE
jgi:hypothetical protein